MKLSQLFALVPFVKGDIKIIGGNEVATIEDYPYMASLQYVYGGHFCGGSIISKNYIMTAAHCNISNSGCSIQ